MFNKHLRFPARLSQKRKEQACQKLLCRKSENQQGMRLVLIEHNIPSVLCLFTFRGTFLLQTISCFKKPLYRNLTFVIIKKLGQQSHFNLSRLNSMTVLVTVAIFTSFPLIQFYMLSNLCNPLRVFSQSLTV